VRTIKAEEAKDTAPAIINNLRNILLFLHLGRGGLRDGEREGGDGIFFLFQQTPSQIPDTFQPAKKAYSAGTLMFFKTIQNPFLKTINDSFLFSKSKRKAHNEDRFALTNCSSDRRKRCDKTIRFVYFTDHDDLLRCFYTSM
jgi:hypothetical protein